jgi:hypothetical protein
MPSDLDHWKRSFLTLKLTHSPETSRMLLFCNTVWLPESRVGCRVCEI